MILTCPNCGTRYRADPGNFSGQGRNVRCAKCSHVWFQTPPEPEPAPASIVPPSEAATLRAGGGTLGAIVTERKAAAAAAEPRPLSDPPPRRRGSGVLTGLSIILILALAAATAWAAVHYRQTVVRLWPETARLYGAVGMPVNLTGLAIRDVAFGQQQVQDGTQALSVSGTIVNVSSRKQAIPRLRAILFDDSKRELYRWNFDPGIPALAPGASQNFATTLPNPPPGASAITVNFAPEDG